MQPITAKKRTNITLEYDVYHNAKEFGINISSVANQAIINIIKQKQAQQFKTDLKQTLSSMNQFMQTAGTFDDMDGVW